jgi:hypothetical protein
LAFAAFTVAFPPPQHTGQSGQSGQSEQHGPSMQQSPQSVSGQELQSPQALGHGLAWTAGVATLALPAPVNIRPAIMATLANSFTSMESNLQILHLKAHAEPGTAPSDAAGAVSRSSWGDDAAQHSQVQ